MGSVRDKTAFVGEFLFSLSLWLLSIADNQAVWEMGSFGFVGSIWISCNTSPPCGCILMLSVVSSILEPLSSGSAVTTVEASKVSIEGSVWYLLCLLSSIFPAKFHFLLLLPLKTPHSCPHFVCDIESWYCVSGSWYIDDVIFLLVSSILGFDNLFGVHIFYTFMLGDVHDTCLFCFAWMDDLNFFLCVCGVSSCLT